jgi:hypothetical protein
VLKRASVLWASKGINGRRKWWTCGQRGVSYALSFEPAVGGKIRPGRPLDGSQGCTEEAGGVAVPDEAIDMSIIAMPGSRHCKSGKLQQHPFMGRYLVLYFTEERLHDASIVPLDSLPHPPSAYSWAMAAVARTFVDSSGHPAGVWEDGQWPAGCDSRCSNEPMPPSKVDQEG